MNIFYNLALMKLLTDHFNKPISKSNNNRNILTELIDDFKDDVYGVINKIKARKIKLETFDVAYLKVYSQSNRSNIIELNGAEHVKFSFSLTYDSPRPLKNIIREQFGIMNPVNEIDLQINLELNLRELLKNYTGNRISVRSNPDLLNNISDIECNIRQISHGSLYEDEEFLATINKLEDDNNFIKLLLADTYLVIESLEVVYG